MNKNPAQKEKYLFGPVHSRRLGLSLGVDIVPLKACTLNCVYCQLGRTVKTTIERREYVPVSLVLSELKDRIDKGLKADYITISGSGEPTLNSSLGSLIYGIKKITEIPVAVLTNGTLFNRIDIRQDCSAADVVLPSLDAADELTFQKINRPHPSINVKNLISGLIAFRGEFTGEIWLEVFIIDGINTDFLQLTAIKNAIELIRPDKIQLNTAVRPTAEEGIKKANLQKLNEIAAFLGPACEVIADFSQKHHRPEAPQAVNLTCSEGLAESVFSILKRRPCSLNHISEGLSISKEQAQVCIEYLQKQGLITTQITNNTHFFSSK